MGSRVAIVHDYLTQRGGAERVVLALMKAFPAAPLYTALYEPGSTFPEFGDADVRVTGLDRVRPFRRDHRRALPLYPFAFGRLRVDADVVVASSSGFAHGVATTGRKVVYCHTPPRWLDQTDRYLQELPGVVRTAFGAARPLLDRWDRRAAASADDYLVNSRAVRERVLRRYGREATVVPPPFAVSTAGDREPVDGLSPGFLLTVSRLAPYKNVDVVVDSFADLPDQQLVVVGDGPDADRVRRRAPANVVFLGSVSDAQLRWLYQACRGLVTASYEDYGLTPLEGAAFGRPTAALAFGGFLDTIVDGETGVLFDRPDVTSARRAVTVLLDRAWNEDKIVAHADAYSEDRFVQRVRGVVLDREGARW